MVNEADLLFINKCIRNLSSLNYTSIMVQNEKKQVPNRFPDLTKLLKPKPSYWGRSLTDVWLNCIEILVGIVL